MSLSNVRSGTSKADDFESHFHSHVILSFRAAKAGLTKIAGWQPNGNGLRSIIIQVLVARDSRSNTPDHA